MWTHFRKHGAIAVCFRMIEQQMLQQRHIKKLREGESLLVLAEQNLADFFIKIDIARKPTYRVEGRRKRHDTFKRNTAVGGAQADKTAEAGWCAD
ncbi:hypothetical protein D9M69_626790 [compost metagenome]